MFSVGQRVWHRGGPRSGTVLECDVDQVFIEQDNGADLEYPASELIATPPAAEKVSAELKTIAQAGSSAAYRLPSHFLKYGDITADHMRVLGMVPVHMLQAVASVFARRSGAGKFGALDVAGKLNVITEITAVPYRTMREYCDRANPARAEFHR